MKLIHFSSRRNRDSILKNGILPSYIKLEPHYKCFKEFGLTDRKCVYMWNPDEGQGMEKYVKDMIYCKLFIHPRNDMADERVSVITKLYNENKLDDWYDDKNWIDFSKLGTKLFGEEDIYDLYEIDFDDNNPLLLDTSLIHSQENSNNIFNSCHLMKDKYEHNDKTIHIGNGIIQPEKIKIIENVRSIIYKNNTIGIRFSKNI